MHSPELLDAQEILQAQEKLCETLKQRLDDRETELRDARDLIFRLQPSHQHITHNEAQTKYKALCESVASWIDYKFGDNFTDDPVARKNLNLKYDIKYAKELLDRTTPSARYFYKLKDSDEYHIISCVMNFLLLEILSKVFYGAASDGAIAFLDLLERSMGCLEPRRGKRIL
jgi:hypothetical protein